MQVTSYQRAQSGDICTVAGRYEFDGYLDKPPGPLPPVDEMEVVLGAGDVFPPIQAPRRACYWRCAEGSEMEQLNAVRRFLTEGV